MKPCLQLQQISKSFGNRKIIHQLSFTFQPGCYCIVGANGIGKSTILELLAGVETLDSGDIFLHTQHTLPYGSLDYKKELCYIPSAPQFFPTASAQDFIDFVSHTKKTASFSTKRLTLLIEQFELRDYLNCSFSKLSLGTQKKLFLTTLAMAPHSLIVLDEPTNALDVKSNRILVDTLQQLVTNAIVIIVSHEPKIFSELSPTLLQLTQSPIQQFVLSEATECYF